MAIWYQSYSIIWYHHFIIVSNQFGKYILPTNHDTIFVSASSAVLTLPTATWAPRRRMIEILVSTTSFQNIWTPRSILSTSWVSRDAIKTTRMPESTQNPPRAHPTLDQCRWILFRGTKQLCLRDTIKCPEGQSWKEKQLKILKTGISNLIRVQISAQCILWVPIFIWNRANRNI